MKSLRIVRVILVAALSLASIACAGQLFRNYGQITPDEAITKAIESYTINPDFRYYITGSDIYPNAFMGLHRDYHLDPAALWKPVDMTPEKMKEIVQGMNTKVYSQHEAQKGFEILDNNGRPIGVWYSIMRARTFVSMKEDGTVRIDTPDLDIYEKKTGSILRDTEK